MNDSSIYVGLDYHQASVQVCIMNRTGQILANRKCENSAIAIAEAVHPYGTRPFAAIESCTGAANLAEQLIQNEWSVDLAHPGYVARLKQSPDKHDWGDARLLADLERVGYLPKVWLAPEPIRELRRLVRYRQQLAAERKNLRLRIRAMLRDQRLICTAAQPWTRRWLEWLRSEAALSEEGRWIVTQQLTRLEQLETAQRDVEARLTQRTADDPVVTQLRTFKGIGPVTAWTLRAEVGRFDRFRSGKQLSRFCGLSPRNASSGQRQADSGLIRAGNRQLRATLIEAAHRLARLDSRWLALADEMEQRGKPKSVVIAAVANRWLRWLFHQLPSAAATAAAA